MVDEFTIRRKIKYLIFMLVLCEKHDESIGLIDLDIYVTLSN
jgi:hypothetical protein